LEGADYELRDKIKECGGRWDRDRKRWYFLGDVPEMLADLVKTPSQIENLDQPSNPLEEALEHLGAAVQAKLKVGDVLDTVDVSFFLPEEPTQIVEAPAPIANRGGERQTLRSAPPDDAQSDFFVPRLYDVNGKDSRSIMDVAVFRLSKKDHRPGAKMRIELPDGYVEVTSGPEGMASVWDYDIVLMAISHLTEAMNRFRAGQGEKPGRIFRPSLVEMTKFCRRGIGGNQYQSIEAALDRLSSTKIKVIRKGSQNGQKIRDAQGGESLINNYRVVSLSESGKVLAVEIRLSDWTYQEVVESKKPDVLTMHRDYFLIDQGIARFLYRLARQAAGKTQARWSFHTIYKRSGSTGTFKEFCRNLRGIIKNNDLPEYHLAEDEGQQGPNLTMTYRNQGEATTASGG
jgi:plasmid replication initiation protein